MVRAALARSRFATLRLRYRAAVMIQKHARRWSARRAYQAKKKQVVKVQSGTDESFFCFVSRIAEISLYFLILEFGLYLNSHGLTYFRKYPY